MFLNTLREQSEHEGRARPSAAETLAAVTNGLGTRLDAQLAARAAVAGMALTVGAQVAITVAQRTEGSGLVEDVFPNGPLDSLKAFVILAVMGATAVLVVAGVVALARSYHLLTSGRASVTLGLSWGALALVYVAQYVWALSQISGASPVLVLGLLLGLAAVAGTVSSWFVASALLARTRLRRLPRTVLSSLATVLLVGLAGLCAESTTAWVAVGLCVVVLSVPAPGQAASPIRPLVPLAPPTRRRVRVLAGASAMLLIPLCSAVSLSLAPAVASSWYPEPVLLLAASFAALAAALGVRAARHGERRHAWGPLVLCDVALTTVMLADAYGSSQHAVLSLVATGAAGLGVATTWWLSSRRTMSESVVAGLAVSTGSMVYHSSALPAVAFASLVLAIVLAVRGDLPRRLRRPAAASEA